MKNQDDYDRILEGKIYQSSIEIISSCCSNVDNCNNGESFSDTNTKWCEMEDMDEEMSCPEKGVCAVCWNKEINIFYIKKKDGSNT